MSEYVPAPPGEPPMENFEALDAAAEARVAFHRAVTAEAYRIRVRKAATDLVRSEERPPADPFDAGTLTELLARPEQPEMRVDGLIPSDASTLLVAARKAGKTTLELNWARSLLTGEPFLGRYPVRPVTGTVAVLNFEVSGATFARWAREHGLPGERLFVVNVRGRRNPLADEEDRARLADLLRAHDVEAITVDPFGRAYTGRSQNDSGEVGAWLVDLDRFARAEVGASDLLLTAHAGWNGERTRGASALEDWADAVITLTRSDDPNDDRRYLRAIGRDVDVEEDRLDYDPRTRTLTLTGAGSRTKAKTDRKLDALAVIVERVAAQRPGVTVGELLKAAREEPDAPAFRDADVSKAAKLARDRGLLRIESEGPGRPSKHYSTVVVK